MKPFGTSRLRPALAILAVVSATLLPSAVLSHPSSSSSSPPSRLSKRGDWYGEPEAPNQPPDEKYFHEAGDSEEMGHYDARFFHDLIPYEEHRVNLRLLVRSYLSVFRELEVETWLAHGTLLGWWWNGRIMPWDYDLDVQVSSATLFRLADHYNRTEHEYSYVDELTGARATKRYLLDVNPSHRLPRREGKNIIDARWIDVSNGMYVDITGISERNPEMEPGVWSCKNFHRYRTTDLYPMRDTEYEGVTATVPYNFERILIEEYGVASLATTEWLGHRWSPDRKEWIKILEEQ